MIRPLFPDCCSKRVSLTVWLKQRLFREISYLRGSSTRQKLIIAFVIVNLFLFQCQHGLFQFRCWLVVPLALPGPDTSRFIWFWSKPSCQFGTQPFYATRSRSPQLPAFWEHRLIQAPTSPDTTYPNRLWCIRSLFSLVAFISLDQAVKDHRSLMRW